MSFSTDQWLVNEHPNMLDTLKAWSNINSGSYNIEGLDKMAMTIKTYIEEHFEGVVELKKCQPMEQMGDDGKLFQRPLGPVLSLTVRPEASRRILFCGHMDTVFPKESDFQQWHQIDGNTLGGPGVADMKGGILVMLNALRAFEQRPEAKQIGWQILLNSDEEIGSHGSMPFLIEAAKNAHLGMVYEPSMPDGWLAGARRGSGNYSLVVHGKAAHAGREYHLGRNAIAALSTAMVELDKLNDLRESITLNLARLNGGGPTNIVPELAMCQFNIRVETLQDQDFAEAHVATVVEKIAALDGFRVELHGGFGRPPKPATAEQEKLFDLVRQCGKKLNINLDFRPTGGCCDGNNLLAAGLPNIDTLGVQGGDIHSSEEYMLVDSLVDRARLSIEILSEIAINGDHWLNKTT